MCKVFRCDLHVHTCLSPCAELDMYPRAVVDRCLAMGLDVIAVCDHNASESVPYVARCAAGTPLTVLPGMEITSREEVHVLAIFDNMNALSRLQPLIYDHLPGENDEDAFGCQAIVNERDEVEGINTKLLIGATELSLSVLVGHIHGLGGLAVAAHIDRESFSVLSQLGFLDPDTPFDALEVSAITGIEGGRKRYPEFAEYPLIQSSDAHFIKDIGRVFTSIAMKSATVSELKLAFTGSEGRAILA